MMISRRFRTVLHDQSVWIALLFLSLAVIAPAGCVLWFMNEAARTEAEAAKQSVTEAYRGQLRFVRDRLDSYWMSKAQAVEYAARLGFAGVVKSSVADSVILPDYPGTAMLETEDKSRARDAQAQIRSLVRNHDKEMAIQTIAEYFDAGPLSRSAIAADEQLLALHLLNPNDRRRSAVLSRLIARLNDYRVPLPSAQRLFLMHEVRAIDPSAPFATLQAEQIAQQFLEAGGLQENAVGLQRARAADIWMLRTSAGGPIALYRTSTVHASMKKVISENTTASGVRFDVFPPDQNPQGEALAAGSILPGWQIGLTVLNSKLAEQAAQRRRSAYLWAGYLVVTVITLAGLVVGAWLRKQLQVARLKTDLVAAVSHELRTPLASMRVLVDSLLEDEALDALKVREYLHLVSGENLRLTRLIENFLTFSRIERNRQRVELRDVAPASVVDIAARLLRERLTGSACDFQVEIEPGLQPIHADPDALTTVLLNLLDNACKYTPSEKRIRLRAYAESDHVIFAVEDNGIGIAAREQKRIFRRFYQVDQRLARETGGCGLGLSIVEFLVRAHGGEVRVSSQPGAGSTFTVALRSVNA